MNQNAYIYSKCLTIFFCFQNDCFFFFRICQFNLFFLFVFLHFFNKIYFTTLNQAKLIHHHHCHHYRHHHHRRHRRHQYYLRRSFSPMLSLPFFYCLVKYQQVITRKKCGAALSNFILLAYILFICCLSTLLMPKIKVFRSNFHAKKKGWETK